MATTVTGYSNWGGPYNNFRIGGTITRTAVSIPNNTSTVTFSFWVESNASGSYTNLPTTRDLWFDGSQVLVWTENHSVGLGSTSQVSSDSRTITHNNNGTRSVGAGIVVSNSWIGNFHLDITLVLDNIPRATDPSWTGNFMAGTGKSISLPRASTSFTHEVAYNFGSSGWVNISTNATTSVTWNPPVSLLTHIPNAMSGNGTLRVITKNGTTSIGTKTKNFTLEAPTTAKPTVNNVVYNDYNSVVKSNIGAFVQGLSKLKATVSASGYQGSTITSKFVRIGSSTYPDGADIDHSGAGTITATGEAIDSRGQSNTKAANFTVLPYFNPKQNAAIKVERVVSNNISADTDDEGTHLRVTLNASAASLIVGGTEKNRLKVEVITRPIGGAPTPRNTFTHTGVTYNNKFMITGGGTYLATQSYQVTINLSDNTGSGKVPFNFIIPTSTVTLDLNGNKIGIGKYNTRGALDVAGHIYTDSNLYTDGSINATGGGSFHNHIYVHDKDVHLLGSGRFKDARGPLEPPGIITPYAGSTAPQGWLFCRGQAVARTTYPELFAVIGTIYGAGNGSTTFNLPNLQGRVPVGFSSETEFNTMGKTGGAKTHTLTTAQMPSHSHGPGGNMTNFWGWNGGSGGEGTGWGSANVGTGSTTGSTGSGQAHNNLQPYISLNFIIKT